MKTIVFTHKWLSLFFLIILLSGNFTRGMTLMQFSSDTTKHSLFFKAIHENDLQSVQKLIEEDKSILKSRHTTGEPALLYAIRKNASITKYLLSLGLDPFEKIEHDRIWVDAFSQLIGANKYFKTQRKPDSNCIESLYEKKELPRLNEILLLALVKELCKMIQNEFFQQEKWLHGIDCFNQIFEYLDTDKKSKILEVLKKHGRITDYKNHEQIQNKEKECSQLFADMQAILDIKKAFQQGYFKLELPPLPPKKNC